MEANQSMNDQFLILINRIIEENLSDENFSVEKLAEEAGLSRSMLHRKLVKLTGKSATNYIMEIRLNRAKELLEKDVATVSEIAYKVGFNSTSYFHRAFKKRYKVSPGDIKKKTTASQHHQEDEPNPANKIRNKLKLSGLGMAASLILLAIIISGGIIYFVFNQNNPPVKSIAILPFDNLSPDEENRYFADGIVEDLLNRLSKIEDLKVISRTSSEIFRDKGNKTVPEIAEILDVKYILEGSVQRETDKVRISIQLIDALKDNHILSEQYDRNMSEVFKIQGDIASQIVNELSVYLSDHQLGEITKSHTSNLKAFDYYNIGHLQYCFCTEEKVLASVEYFKKAIEEDSNYALPYAQLAPAYWFLSGSDYFTSRKAGRDSAEMMARKALAIDKNLAEAHAALGTINMEGDLNIEAAEKEFQKAIALNPNSSEACKEYAEFLNVTGRPEEARGYMNKAIILDPLRFNVRRISTILYMDEGNYRKALEENKVCLEIIPDHSVHLYLYFDIYLGLGNEKAAYESFRNAEIITGEHPVEEVDRAYQKEGIDGIIRLRISRQNSPIEKAYSYIKLREYVRAIEVLVKASDHNQLPPFELYRLNHFHPELESYSAFAALKKKMGLD